MLWYIHVHLYTYKCYDNLSQDKLQSYLNVVFFVEVNC